VTAFQAEFGTRRVRAAARRTASEKEPHRILGKTCCPQECLLCSSDSALTIPRVCELSILAQYPNSGAGSGRLRWNVAPSDSDWSLREIPTLATSSSEPLLVSSLGSTVRYRSGQAEDRESTASR